MDPTLRTLIERLEASARKLGPDDADLSQACADAAAYFREEFDFTSEDEQPGAS
jgi:hypothetical protein